MKLEREGERDILNLIIICSSFVLQLILAYELTNGNEYSEAYRKVRGLQNMLCTLQKENCKDSLFVAYYVSLCHVVTSTEAYILLKMNHVSRAKQVKI